jgi:hypothetical protein
MGDFAGEGDAGHETTGLQTYGEYACGFRRGSGLTDKVVLVGDQNVGKTCLVLRYCEDSFWENYKATIGVDFMWQRYLIQGIGFTLHLWDTAGQEKFRSLSQAYYRGARACIAAFDLGVPESLEHCKHVRAPLHPRCPLTALWHPCRLMRRHLVFTASVSCSRAKLTTSVQRACEAADFHSVRCMYYVLRDLPATATARATDATNSQCSRRMANEYAGGWLQWVGEVRAENVQASESANGFCVFLVGCKADHYKVVDRHEAELVAKKLGAEYFEVSAKTGIYAPPRPAPSRGSTGLAGVSTRPAGLPHPWGATSCRKAAPLTICPVVRTPTQ